jgi:hypothetical protein
LAWGHAIGAYKMKHYNGSTHPVIPVCIEIAARDYDLVASNKKCREVRRDAKRDMLRWYKAGAGETGARDFLSRRWKDGLIMTRRMWYCSADGVFERRKSVLDVESYTR